MKTIQELVSENKELQTQLTARNTIITTLLESKTVTLSISELKKVFKDSISEWMETINTENNITCIPNTNNEPPIYGGYSVKLARKILALNLPNTAETAISSTKIRELLPSSKTGTVLSNTLRYMRLKDIIGYTEGSTGNSKYMYYRK